MQIHDLYTTAKSHRWNKVTLLCEHMMQNSYNTNYTKHDKFLNCADISVYPPNSKNKNFQSFTQNVDCWHNHRD